MLPGSLDKVLIVIGLPLLSDSAIGDFITQQPSTHIDTTIIKIIIIELTQSKTILENTVEIKPQPVALDFKNLSQYSSCSK